MKDFTETDGYLAGIIDGEGTIDIVEDNRKGTKRRISYRPTVSIGNTSENLLRFIQSMYGGTITSYHDGVETRKRIYQLRWLGMPEVKRILGFVMRFLVLKEEQAKIVYSFCDSRMAQSWDGRSKPCTDEQLTMFARIRLLNNHNRSRKK